MKNVFVAAHFHSCRIGASRFKGSGENRFCTKRISWSDCKTCFHPTPLADTKPKPKPKPKPKAEAKSTRKLTFSIMCLAIPLMYEELFLFLVPALGYCFAMK